MRKKHSTDHRSIYIIRLEALANMKLVLEAFNGKKKIKIIKSKWTNEKEKTRSTGEPSFNGRPRWLVSDFLFSIGNISLVLTIISFSICII